MKSTRANPERGTGIRPELGSPEFDEHVDRQGQASMDRALGNPCIRIFCGVFVVGAVFVSVCLYDCVAVCLEGRSPEMLVQGLWMTYVTAELGSVAVRGRSIIPLYRAIVGLARSIAPRN